MKEPSSDITEWDTGVDTDVLKFVGSKSVQFPPDFNVHSHLKKHHIDGRLKKLETGTGIDWGSAEALAFGSLLYQVIFSFPFLSQSMIIFTRVITFASVAKM